MRFAVRYASVACCLILAQGVLAVDATVDLTYAKYAGTQLSSGITQWLGIPFAAPPVGNLRFAPPQDPVSASGTQKANKVSSRS